MTLTVPPRLIALSPGDLTPGSAEAWRRDVGSAVQGGLRCLVLREPGWAHGPLLDLAAVVAALLLEVDGALIVHDAAHLVAPAKAQGVHLGFRSLAPSDVRGWLKAPAWVGLSTHAGDPPVDPALVTYSFFGPVFPTPSKRGLVEPVGLEALADRSASESVPVWGLGGIGENNASEVNACASGGIAVRSAIWKARKPSSAVEALLAATS